MKTCKKNPAFFSLCLLFLCIHARAENASSNLLRGPDRQVLVDLVMPATGNTETFVDAVLVRYNSNYLASAQDDEIKTAKTGENIASFRDGQDLSEERKPFFQLTDTILLHLTSTSIRDYRLKIIMQNFSVTGLVAKLEDHYLHSSRLLNTYGSTEAIDFSVNADPASADPFRFSVVIITALPLPLTLKSFTATPQATAVLLNWEVTNAVNMLRYEVQRSANGVHFSKLSEVPATTGGGNQRYGDTDAKPLSGTSFYRLRCVDATGTSTYSLVVKVKAGKTATDITLLTNPVNNGLIVLQCSNLAAGDYRLKLFTSTGQFVQQQTIRYNNTGIVTMPTAAVPGPYYIEMSAGEFKAVCRVMLQ